MWATACSVHVCDGNLTNACPTSLLPNQPPPLSCTHFLPLCLLRCTLLRLAAQLAELAKRGWAEKELRGLVGGNFLRVFAAVEGAAHPHTKADTTPWKARKDLDPPFAQV